MNQAAARPAQRLVRRGRDESPRERSGSGEPPPPPDPAMCAMSANSIRADLAGDLAHPFEINDTGIRARAHGDHLRLVLARHLGELIVINPFIFLAHAVVDDLEKFPEKFALLPCVR
jgi:hypothetical protein